MLNDMTRARLIQVWFGVVLVCVAVGMTFRMSVTFGTGTMLFVLSLVPPVIVFLLWPGVQARTASDVLHNVDRRR